MLWWMVPRACEKSHGELCVHLLTNSTSLSLLRQKAESTRIKGVNFLLRKNATYLVGRSRVEEPAACHLDPL